MALFNNAMTVIRQLDTIIKDAACVEDVDRHVRVLDELYDTIYDMADEAHFRILLRRITTIKKSAELTRIRLEEQKAEEEDAEELRTKYRFSPSDVCMVMEYLEFDLARVVVHIRRGKLFDE